VLEIRKKYGPAGELFFGVQVIVKKSLHGKRYKRRLFQVRPGLGGQHVHDQVALGLCARACTLPHTQSFECREQKSELCYRGTSLIIKRNPLGPYTRTMPRSLSWSKEGWRVFTSEHSGVIPPGV